MRSLCSTCKNFLGKENSGEAADVEWLSGIPHVVIIYYIAHMEMSIFRKMSGITNYLFVYGKPSVI